MKYIQHFLGILVVVLCFGFAIVLLSTELIEMEPWRKQVMIAVFMSYGLFRAWRVYKGFKSIQK
ncbi:MAG: hypothetical protein K9J18_02285 [Crocinitomicaceae bacterium]|jgi:hypothetical protein|nr:hypothetical protein [Crocinitomicaceae bacterium]